MIEDVTLRKSDVIAANIRFKGGATRTLTMPLPIPLMLARLTPADTLANLDRLLDSCTDAQGADQLNLLGYRTFTGLPFQAMHVFQLRRAHSLKDRYTRLRAAGMFTADEIAAHMGVAPQTVWHWYRRGWITGACYNANPSCYSKA